MNKIALALVNLFSFTALASVDYPVHILPGSPSENYTPYIEQAWQNDAGPTSSYVKQALAVGARNLQWLDYLNANRPDSIALTKPGELQSYPIDKPNTYSPALIEQRYNDLYQSIPAELRKIIFENADFTKTLPIAVSEYVRWAKKVDGLYQTAARWTSLSANLAWYSRNKMRDIRGYYFLRREKDLSSKLNNWNTLPAADRSRLTIYLVNICENSSIATSQCQSALNSAITQNRVLSFFTKYNPRAQTMYDAYFKLGGVRRELQWTSQNANLAIVPFRQTDAAIEKFLAVNIEDEWKWKGWQLKLDFQPNADIRVVFQAGVVPHVNGIAGNTIVMDKNASLNEWDVQWTIRHEFGHVLGFPDCYVEFYDTAAQQMVNYQIDVTDLMCSRAGALKQNHFDEMKSNYFK